MLATRLLPALNPNPPRVASSDGRYQNPATISHLLTPLLPSQPLHFSLVSSSLTSQLFISLNPSSSSSSSNMLLKATAAGCSLCPSRVEKTAGLSSNSFSSRTYSMMLMGFERRRNGLVVCAEKQNNTNSSLTTGVLFEPFEEVKNEVFLTPSVPQVSLARQKYMYESEAAINEQINVEYNVSYAYHAMYAYFDRDNIALKGLAHFFKESSEEERGHAEKLMEYQNKRGGRVVLHSIVRPISEFDHADLGDALYAMELALSLEKLTNEKLLHLHSVATKNNDVQMADFVETEYLTEQVESIKKISEYVAQLRRVGKGHGVWHFDQSLLNGAAA